MATGIAIAIVTAISALLGAAIPTWFNYKNNLKQNQFIKERALLEKQKECYWILMSALQNMVNSNSDKAFEELQKAVVLISIYGDNETSKSLNDYYMVLVSSATGKRSFLREEEHNNYHKKIINGMRKNLGLDQFAEFKVIAFRPSELV